MPKKVKKTGVIVTIPETWEMIDPVSGKKTDLFLGGGRVKIFNVLDREEAEIREKTGSLNFVTDDSGNVRQATKTNEILFRELTFLARTTGLDSSDCFWEGFEDENDNPMNCTTENRRKWAYETNLYLFVCHVGKLLDAEAENRASEEEKNSLRLLAGTPVGDQGSGKTAKSAKSHGQKG
jgi:hypothetical protein